MALFRMFKKVQHQKFDYKPRFYDPEKEEQSKRLERYKNLGEKEDNLEYSKDRIRTGLRSRQSYAADATYRSKQVRKSNMRLLMIIAVLIMATILLFYSGSIDGLLSGFLK